MTTYPTSQRAWRPEATRLAFVWLVFLIAGAAGQTQYGCQLNSTRCGDHGFCEKFGFCTCNQGYYGEVCENKIAFPSLKTDLAKGFITFWVIFWVLLNFLLPYLIYLVIIYLQKKNCDQVKSHFEDCRQAFCCCIKARSEETSHTGLNQFDPEARRLSQPNPPEVKSARSENEIKEGVAPNPAHQANLQTIGKPIGGSNASSKKKGEIELSIVQKADDASITKGLLFNKNQAEDILGDELNVDISMRALKGISANNFNFIKKEETRLRELKKKPEDTSLTELAKLEIQIKKLGQELKLPGEFLEDPSVACFEIISETKYK